MADQVKSSWQYNPLNGEELIKWIFADAWPKLKADNQFMPHLSYHNPQYRLKLEVLAYDGLSKGVSNAAMAETGGKLQTSEKDMPLDAVFTGIKVEASSESLKEPDKARELLDEGRYKVVNVDGVLVDKKVKRGEKDGKQ